MTTNFYAPPSAIRSNRVVLPEEEAHHARTVLRAEKGDILPVVDGEGGWYRVRIDHLAPKQVVGTIVERREEVGESDVDVTVGLGLLSKRRRFETFVEKAVELGVRNIVPLHTARTEVEQIREERLRNIMVAAMKQCRRSQLPTLQAPHTLEVLLDASEANTTFLCDARGDAVPILQALGDSTSDPSFLILVGPEGGFTTSEVEAARAAGSIPVTLGPRRLRAETAALGAANAVLLAYERHSAEA